jgi:uncharacterized membrane-anchored protein
MNKNLALLSLLLTFFFGLHAEKTAEDTTLTTEQVLSLLDTLKYQKTGKASLGLVAGMDIPAGYKFLDGKQAEFVLHDLWGNPPGESLGMLVPENGSPFLGSWVVDVTYLEDGYVKDEDAKEIDYTDLLKKMQEEQIESNEERKKQGYSTAMLLGWASPPYYDQKEHKLHWAKRIKFEGDSMETLNYDIRILGRKGVLVLQAIGNIDDLEAIKAATPAILKSVNFEAGNKYEDFDASADKVAAYGIGGLIAGGVLAKTGLLAKIGIMLLKFWKLLFLGIAGLFGGVVKFFKGKRNSDEAEAEFGDNNQA